MRLANATPARLREVTALNLDALAAILRWNREHGIEVFRISSNTIPFGSHPVNTVRWWEEFAGRLEELGRLMDGMSISTHPGQYTVLGSARPEVVDASLAELEYQALLLRSLGLDTSHRVVIHLSGTPERFLAAADRLSDDARARLVLENDERWSLEDVLSLGLPVVFDAFHHQLRPSLPELDVRGAVLEAAKMWAGRQEVHFSTQQPGKRAGAHAETLDRSAFASLVRAVGDLPLDCVLEVKDKERSALIALEVCALHRPEHLEGAVQPKKGVRMATIEESIEVDVPVRTAYDQWTQFEEFPRFMEGVKEVRQLDDTHLHWVVEHKGQEHEFDAEISEQRPDERVAWTTTDGKSHAGVVTFHRLDDNRSRIMVQMKWEPEGMLETLGAAIGSDNRRVQEDLERFKEMIEGRGGETGAWRGEVEQGDVRR